MPKEQEGFWNNYHKNRHPQPGELEAPNFRETKDHIDSCRNCKHFDYDGYCVKHGFYSHGSAAGDNPYSALHTCDSRITS